MRIKYRMTGFARFLIFLIFFAPICYVGYAYYNGEDGIQKIKNLFSKSESNSKSEKAISKDRFGIGETDVLKEKDVQIELLMDRIEKLEEEIEGLRKGQHKH